MNHNRFAGSTKKEKKESFRVNKLAKPQYIVCRFVLPHRKNGIFSHSQIQENAKTNKNDANQLVRRFIILVDY